MPDEHIHIWIIIAVASGSKAFTRSKAAFNPDYSLENLEVYSRRKRL